MNTCRLKMLQKLKPDIRMRPSKTAHPELPEIAHFSDNVSLYLKKKKLNNIRIIFVEIDNIMKHYH